MHPIPYGAAMTGTESKSDFKLTTCTQYLAQTGELWGVFCENFGEKWPSYNVTTLYIGFYHIGNRRTLQRTISQLKNQNQKWYEYVLLLLTWPIKYSVAYFFCVAIHVLLNTRN